MKKTNLFDEIFCGISVKIIKGYHVSHNASWIESKTKLDYTLWNITDGDLHIKINGREYTAYEGDVILFYPGDKYSAWSDNGCRFVFVFFSLEMGQSLDLLSNVKLSGIIPAENIGNQCRKFCVEFIEQGLNAPHTTLKMYSVFLSYLSDILYIAQNKESVLFYDVNTDINGSDMWDVINYINEHFLEGLQIKRIATKFNLSEKYFISKFKAVTGIPPRQYIMQCKMRKAIELISNTESKMTEIAHALGYADQYAFSKAFKKYYGEAPSCFR